MPEGIGASESGCESPSQAVPVAARHRSWEVRAARWAAAIKSPGLRAEAEHFLAR